MTQDQDKRNYLNLNNFIFCFNKNIILLIKEKYYSQCYNIYSSEFINTYRGKKYFLKEYKLDNTNEEYFYGIKIDKYREFILTKNNINSILNNKNNFIAECFFIDNRIHETRTNHKNKETSLSFICNFIILKDDIFNIDFKFITNENFEEAQLLSVLDQSLTFAKYEKIDAEIYLKYNNNKISVYGKNTYINKYNIKF